MDGTPDDETAVRTAAGGPAPVAVRCVGSICMEVLCNTQVKYRQLIYLPPGTLPIYLTLPTVLYIARPCAREDHYITSRDLQYLLNDKINNITTGLRLATLAQCSNSGALAHSYASSWTSPTARTQNASTFLPAQQCAVATDFGTKYPRPSLSPLKRPSPPTSPPPPPGRSWTTDNHCAPNRCPHVRPAASGMH